MSPGPSTVDPAQAFTRDDWLAIGAVHESLYRLDKHGKAVVNLLASITQTTKRSKKWVCFLRKDIQFHSGDPIRARDVKQSFERLKGTRYGWIPKWIKIIPSRTEDTKFTVRSRKHPLTMEELGNILASPALSILPAGGDGRVGAGPFRIPERGTNSGDMVLERYKEHHRGAPYLESLVFRRFSDWVRVRDQFRIGKLDVVFSDSFDPLDRLPNSRFQTGVSATGRHPESIGLLVPRSRTHIAVSERKRVRAAIVRTTVRNRIPGKTRKAENWVPIAVAKTGKVPNEKTSARGSIRWRLACPRMLKDACQAIAVGTPNVLMGSANRAVDWPIALLSLEEEKRARAHPERGSWDALLLSVIHVDSLGTGALSSLNSLIGGEPRWGRSRKDWNRWTWLPLLERRPFMIHKADIQNLGWSQSLFSDLGEVWRR